MFLVRFPFLLFVDALVALVVVTIVIFAGILAGIFDGILVVFVILGLLSFLILLLQSVPFVTFVAVLFHAPLFV